MAASASRWTLLLPHWPPRSLHTVTRGTGPSTNLNWIKPLPCLSTSKASLPFWLKSRLLTEVHRLPVSSSPAFSSSLHVLPPDHSLVETLSCSSWPSHMLRLLLEMLSSSSSDEPAPHVFQRPSLVPQTIAWFPFRLL